MALLSCVLRIMGRPSGLTRPEEVLQETKRMIYSKPPRHRISAAQSFFVMSVFAAAMLGPAAWILHHLPQYRERAQQVPPGLTFLIIILSIMLCVKKNR